MPPVLQENKTQETDDQFIARFIADDAFHAANSGQSGNGKQRKETDQQYLDRFLADKNPFETIQTQHRENAALVAADPLPFEDEPMLGMVDPSGRPITKERMAFGREQHEQIQQREQEEHERLEAYRKRTDWMAQIRSGLGTGLSETTPGLVRQLATGEKHKPLIDEPNLLGRSVAGVSSFMLDPVTYASGGVGSIIGKKILASQIKKAVIKAVGARAAGGAATLGGLELAKDPFRQKLQQGYVDPLATAGRVATAAGIGAVASPFGLVRAGLKGVAGKAAGLGVEAAAFTGAMTVGEGVSGAGWRWPTVEDYVDTLAMFAGIKGAGAVGRGIKGAGAVGRAMFRVANGQQVTKAEAKLIDDMPIDVRKKVIDSVAERVAERAPKAEIKQRSPKPEKDAGKEPIPTRGNKKILAQLMIMNGRAGKTPDIYEGKDGFLHYGDGEIISKGALRAAEKEVGGKKYQKSGGIKKEIREGVDATEVVPGGRAIEPASKGNLTPKTLVTAQKPPVVVPGAQAESLREQKGLDPSKATPEKAKAVEAATKPSKRVGLQEATKALTDIETANSGLFEGGTEVEIRDVQDVPTVFTGLSFKAGGAHTGRKQAVEKMVAGLRELLPKKLKRKITIVESSDPRYAAANGEDILARIGDTQAVAQTIIDANAHRSQEAKVRNIAEQILESPKSFSPEDVLAAMNFQSIVEGNKVVKAKAGSYEVGDKMSINGEEHEVVNKGHGFVTLENGLTLTVKESAIIAAEVGGTKKDATDFNFGANVDLLGEKVVKPKKTASGPPRTLSEKMDEQIADNKAEAKQTARDKIEGQGNFLRGTGKPEPRVGKITSLKSPLADASDRIPTAPIATKPTAEPSTTPSKSLKNIVLDIGTSLVQKIRVGRVPKGAKGEYKTTTSKLAIRFEGDLDTVAHELGHRLDDQFGLGKKWSALETSPFDNELIPAFSKYGYKKPSGKEFDFARARAEGIAEWLRAYIGNPMAATKAAPKFFAHYEATIPKSVRKAIDVFSTDIRAWDGSTAIQKTLANISLESDTARKRLVKAVKDAGEPFKIGWIDRLNAVGNDSLAYVWLLMETAMKVRGIEHILPKEDARILIRGFPHIGGKIIQMLDTGMRTTTNKKIAGLHGMDWLMEPLGGKKGSSYEANTLFEIEANRRLVIVQTTNERVLEKARSNIAKGERIIELDARARNIKRDMKVADPELQKQLLGEYKKVLKQAGKIKTSLGYKGGIKGLQAFIKRRNDRLSGFGGGRYSDVDIAHEALSEIDALPKERQVAIAEGARRLRMWHKATLEYARDRELVSKEDFARIEGENEYYVSFQRLFEEIDSKLSSAVSRYGSTKNPIKRFFGSTRTLQDPYFSLMQGMGRIVTEGDKNAGLLGLWKLVTSDRKLYDDPHYNLSELMVEGQKGDPNTIHIRVKGESKYIQLHPEAYKAINNWFEKPGGTLRTVLKPFEWAMVILKAGVIYTTPFMIRNVPRDAMMRRIVSRTGTGFFDAMRYLTPKGFKQYQEAVEQLRLNSGAMFGYTADPRTYRSLQRAAIRKAAGRKDTILSMPRHFYRGIIKLANQSEMIGRAPEVIKARKYAKEKLGYDDTDAGLYAARQAAELMDFSMMGKWVREVNRYMFPFAGPAVRGNVREAQAFIEAPKRTVARWVTGIVSLTLAARWYAALTETEEERKSQPSYIRDMFSNFKVGPNLWFRFPMPWTFGVFASGVDRALDAAGGDKKAFEGWVGSFIDAASPIDTGLMFGPFRGIAGAITNYDAFRKTRPVPPWEEGLDLELRTGTDRASRMGQMLQGMFGVDARKIDMLIDAQFGNAGRISRKVSDVGREDRPLMDVFNAFSGVFSGSPASQSRDATWVKNYAKRRGLQTDPALRPVRELTTKWSESTSMKSKDELARKVRAAYRNLRTALPIIDKRKRLLDKVPAAFEEDRIGSWLTNVAVKWNATGDGKLYPITTSDVRAKILASLNKEVPLEKMIESLTPEARKALLLGVESPKAKSPFQPAP